MKIKDLRKTAANDLDAKMTELRKELIKLNAQVATGTQMKSSKQISQIKRTIAQIKTLKQEGKEKAS